MSSILLFLSKKNGWTTLAENYFVKLYLNAQCLDIFKSPQKHFINARTKIKNINTVPVLINNH